MARYDYRGVDAQGEPIQGTMDAESARAVVDHFTGQGALLSAVTPVEKRPWILPRSGRLTLRDIEDFTSQMHSLLRGGMPVAPALAEMVKGPRRRAARAVIEDMRRHVEAGNSLESALERHPESFSPVFLALVRAGERAGNLPGVFQSLAGQTRQALGFKHQLQVALTYPVLLILIGGAIITFLMVKVVPVFAEIFNDFGGMLPAPTRFLVDISDFWLYHGFSLALELAIALLAMGIASRALRRYSEWRYRLDWIKMCRPLGRIYWLASVSRFCRSLGMLIEARIPLADSLTLAGAAAGNAVLETVALEAARKTSAGATLSQAFEVSGAFDSGFCWLLGNAERNAELDKVLLDLSEDYDRSCERLSDYVLSLTGPITAIALGFVVGFIVVSLYLPIFSLGDCISGG